MDLTAEQLATLSGRYSDDLESVGSAALEPPAGLPDEALIWLALAPVWTARMAAACGFPDEAIEAGSGRVARRRYRSFRLQDFMTGSAGDREAAVAATHAFALVELENRRSGAARELLNSALAGHEELGQPAGVVAALYQLSELDNYPGSPDQARAALMRAASVEGESGDDIGARIIARRLAGAGDPVTPEPADGPSGSQVLEAARVLERLRSAGLCEAAIGDAAESGPNAAGWIAERRCWMPDVLRQRVVEQVVRDPERGTEALAGELSIIGERVVAQVSRYGLEVPQAVLTWARLAALAPDVAGMAALLSRECGRLLSFDESVEPNPSGTALGWIQAAEPLEELLRGELTVALDRAKRQLNLFHRRLSDDRRYLKHFVEREEQLAAVDELLAADPDPADQDPADPAGAWALHFIGSGGTGKTMLMRYISSVVGPGRGGATARIDFDYLNPDYPAQRPGLLLAALAEELRLSAEGGATSFFAQFDHDLELLEEQRTGRRQGAGTRAGDISPADVLRTFGQALAALPRPVILLIDTCEELAKVRRDGTSPAGVERTFEILEYLHGAVPELKVIFAGRRPLASSGAGWRAVAGGSADLPGRPYLRLHEIRSFAETEALGYLESEGVPEPLRAPILAQSADPGQADRFTWTDSSRAPDSTIARFSPFELSGWAALARPRAGEALTPADIVSADVDRYIELRIIRRIRYEPLKLALPALGLLGRCDSAMLRAVLPDVPDFDKMFAELQLQEWITRRGVGFYELDDSLRRRLLAHYQRVSPDEVEQCYLRAVAYIEQLTLHEPLAELLPLHFDTALRVLRREPARAARWWARVEARFAREEQYEWARQLAEFMLGPDGACAEVDPYGDRGPAATSLRAGVLATQLACFTHTKTRADRAGLWQEVDALLADYPDAPAEKDALRYRSRVGQLAASAERASPDASTAQAKLWGSPFVRSPQICASYVAAAEELVEAVERASPESSGPEPPATSLSVGAGLLKYLAEIAGPRGTGEGALPSDLRAFAGSLAARVSVLLGNLASAETYFRASLALAEQADARAHGQWLDWRPPDDLLARLRVEAVRGLYPAALGAHEVLRLAGSSPDALATVDEERLASAQLIVRAARRVPDNPWKDLHPQRLVALTAELRPERNAHRAFPALAVAVAQVTAAAGEVDEALSLLRLLGRSSERSSVELDVVADATRAELAIVRRMRLRDEGLGSAGSLAGSSLLADQELLWSLDGLDGAKSARADLPAISLWIPDGADSAAWHHARWRTLSPLAWSAPELAEFARALPELAARTPEDFGSCSVFLDLIEAGELLDDVDQVSAGALAQRSGTLTGWWNDHPDQPEESLRLLLRVAALKGTRRATVPGALLHRLGTRRAAQIALDEGEMLALRLPERALPILDAAQDWSIECRDYGAAIIARTLSGVLLARMGGAQVRTSLSTDTRTDLGFFSSLPSWPELHELAENLSGAALDELGPVGWRPWLVRIIACDAWTIPSGSKPVRLRRLQDWIDEHYGELRQEASGRSPTYVAVPAELDGWLSTARSVQAINQPWQFLDLTGSVKDAWRRSRDLRRRGQPYLVPAILLFWRSLLTYFLIGYVVVVTAYLGVLADGLGLLAGVAVSIVVLSVVLPAKRRRYGYLRRSSATSRRTTPRFAVARVKAGPTVEAARISLEADGESGELTSYAVEIPSVSSSYDELSRVAPAVRAELTRLRERGTGSRVLELALPSGLAGPCWEAVLAGQDFTDAALSPLRVFRSVPARRLRPVKSWRDITSVVSVLADVKQTELATQGWRRLSRNPRVSRRYSHSLRQPDSLARAGEASDEIDVVHLIATAIRTSSGPRLDLSRATGAQVRSRGGSPTRGELIQASDVVSRFPDVVCCILQSTPQERAVRTEVERLEAATMRVIAEEIFSAGVPTVITIPSLPSALATAVLHEFSQAITARPRLMIAALTSAVTRAQAHVYDAPGFPAEAALDICLYAAEISTAALTTAKRSG